MNPTPGLEFRVQDYKETAKCHAYCLKMMAAGTRERRFFIDNLLVRIHFIIVMVRWTGLAPWVFEQPNATRIVSR